MPNEQVIPEAALRDPKSVEMLRVWIAEKKLGFPTSPVSGDFVKRN